MKAVRNSLLQNVKYIPPRTKNSLPKASCRTTTETKIIPCSPIRSDCIEWLYRAESNLHFSRSTLFIALGLLDKLLVKGLILTHENYELVAGSLLLACTKFNEVYPVTVRKLNLLSEEEHSLNQFIEAEAAILQNIEFTVTLDPIYEQLAELQTHYKGKEAEDVQQLIKMAVMNPNETFKYGSSSLLQAVSTIREGEGLGERFSNGSTQGKQALQIRRELNRLRSASHKRLVSPSRC